MIKNIQEKILKLKEERDVCILAHSYQYHDILEIADFKGDSFQLSVMAQSAKQNTVVMCGVRFMAETVKILSPEKKVILAAPGAGCPMAEQMTREQILEIKKAHPEYAVVAYINTTAELKTVCDVCVTSSSAVKIVESLEAEDILFIPDCNLGSFVQKNVPGKRFHFLEGGCPIHSAVTVEDTIAAKKAYPNALLLSHPECIPGVLELSDFIGSTSAIMNYAVKSNRREFIIGTELAIRDHLQYACPEKVFYPLSKKLFCPDMKLTTLNDVLLAVSGEGGSEIELAPDVIRDARHCIDEMIRLG